MGNNNRQQLRDLVNRQAQELIEEVVRTRGTAPQDRLDELGKLKRLADLPDPERGGGRWILPSVLFGTLLVMSVLLLTHMSSTDIELDINVSEVGFRLPTVQVLNEGSSLRTLGVTGLRKIHLTADDHHLDTLLEAPNGEEQSIQLTARSQNKRDGTITLAEIKVPAGSGGSIRYTGVPNHFRLAITSNELAVNANVHGPILVAASGIEAQEMDFKVPRPVDLYGGGREVDLDLTFPEGSQSGLSQQISVNELAFFDVDEMFDTNGSVLRRLSTIVSGTLYLESLNGQKHELRAGEALEFKNATGEIRALSLARDHISLRFQGKVTDIIAGSGGNRRSLMPTVLESWHARSEISLLWAGTFTIFTLISGMLRWLKIST